MNLGEINDEVFFAFLFLCITTISISEGTRSFRRLGTTDGAFLYAILLTG